MLRAFTAHESRGPGVPQHRGNRPENDRVPAAATPRPPPPAPPSRAARLGSLHARGLPRCSRAIPGDLSDERGTRRVTSSRTRSVACPSAGPMATSWPRPCGVHAVPRSCGRSWCTPRARPSMSFPTNCSSTPICSGTSSSCNRVGQVASATLAATRAHSLHDGAPVRPRPANLQAPDVQDARRDGIQRMAPLTAQRDREHCGGARVSRDQSADVSIRDASIPTARARSGRSSSSGCTTEPFTTISVRRR